MRRAQVVTVDVVAVLVFVLVGRSSHAETGDLLGVLSTAWPFLGGLALGHAVAAWRHVGPAVAMASGVTVWVATVVAGMVLRLVSGSGAPWSFVVVATIVLGVLLLGWRVGRTAIRRARRPRPSRGPRRRSPV